MNKYNYILIWFGFYKSVYVETLQDGEEYEIFTRGNNIFIRADDADQEHLIYELICKAKLAEQDPLLTFKFLPYLSRTDRKYTALFKRLCLPLQDAWAYKMYRHYLDKKYLYEMKKLQIIWNALPAAEVFKNVRALPQYLSMFAILYESGIDIDIKLPAGVKNRISWEEYIAALKKFSRMMPHPSFYVELAHTTRPPYHVEIRQGKYWQYFHVEKRKTTRQIPSCKLIN